MHQLLFLLVIGAAYCAADDEPFSIGLGVLSPSYSQTVGKEKVKVTFDQKDDGQFSYTVGDPKSGTNTYLNFGPSAGSQQQQNSPSGYAAPQPAYQAPTYGSSNQGSSGGYAAPSYGSSNQGSSSGYAAPSYGSSNQGSSGGYAAPSYGSSNQGSSGGYGAAREQQGFLPAGFSYHATEGQAYLRQGGELRKPEGNQGQILPAGFSYHATEGQSFLRQGDSPNFMIESDKQGSARGPAEQSFYTNFQGGAQRGGPGLANGLVGYGQGGPSRGGSLPIGGYAGAQFSGGFQEHGGHE